MTRLARFALILFLSAGRGAFAEWETVAWNDEPSPVAGLVHRYLKVEESETGARAILDMALFSRSACKLCIIDNEASDGLGATMTEKKCLAGVNGGYFDPSFLPLGLRIIEGKTTSRLTRGRLLTGVIATCDNQTQIFRIGEFSSYRRCNAAVESGPFLVDLSRPVRGLEATREARRTFALIGSDNRAALGFCSEMTLADLAKFLARPIGDLKIQRALNLDGGSSSGFWFKRATGSPYFSPEEKTVRDFVAVVPR